MAQSPRKPPSSPDTPKPVRMAPKVSALEREADDLLDEFPMSPSAHAEQLRKGAEAFEDGPERALELASEMERRARAGVRYWYGSAAEQRSRGAAAGLQVTTEGRQGSSDEDPNVDPPMPDDL